MTGEANLRTEMGGSNPAEFAAMTHRRRIDGDSLTSTWPGHDLTGSLMTKDERMVDVGVADASLHVPVTVGSAQSNRTHADQGLGVRGGRLRLLFEAQIAFPV
jgi:hypothetical protein